MSTVRKNMRDISITSHAYLLRTLGCCRSVAIAFLAVMLMAAYCQCAQQSIGDTDVREITSSKQAEIEDFLKNLEKKPDINLVKNYRNKIEGYLEGTKRRYEDAENELKRMQEAFAQVETQAAEEESSGKTNNTVLLEIKEKKEVEVATLKLDIIQLDGALKTIDSYLRHMEAKSLLFRDDGFIKTALAWSGTKHILSPGTAGTNYEKFSKTFTIPAVIILLLLMLVFVDSSINFINQNLNKRNSIFLAARYFSGASSVFRLIVIFLCLGTISAIYLQPVVAKGMLFLHGILLLFCWYAVYLFLRLIVTKYEAEGKDELGNAGKIQKRPLYLFSLWSALLIMMSYGFLAPLFTPDFYILLNSLIKIGWLIFFLFILRGLCKKSAFDASWRVVRLLLLVVIATLVLLEFAGFRALVLLVLTKFCKTAILFSLLFFGIDAADFIVQILHTYRAKMMSRLGLEGYARTTKSSSLTMLTIGAKVILLALSILLFCQIWNITNFKDGKLLSTIMDGISFGGLNISPSRIIIAFVIFALGWPLVSFIQPLIEKKWLLPSSVSESSRDTFLTLSGYLGYALIILITLSIAGIKLTGLTVVVGALSLGIGFGLQNIINNFISGLIIMFERPIKRGDWIQVGTTEGYVKKISIRSTIIQTFDRSDVIVPNSELIANQVTNMMLYDQQGRLRVSVGVAYGSNTMLVKDLLAEIANSHPQVITDGSTPAPRVLFQAFGDSSLNFDVLCHLKDIDLKIQVRSEMHFAIDSAFRKNGIEIPFPQRDVHIRSQPQAADNGDV